MIANTTAALNSRRRDAAVLFAGNRSTRTTMSQSIRLTTAIALFFAAPYVSAQSAPAEDLARHDAVVRQALQTYREGLEKLAATGATGAQVGRTPGGIRELALEEAVSIALEKNLDIQVSRLEPDSASFQIAGVRNIYRFVFSTTLGQRDQVQLFTNQLNGGVRVSNGTFTYNFGVA